MYVKPEFNLTLTQSTVNKFTRENSVVLEMKIKWQTSWKIH